MRNSSGAGVEEVVVEVEVESEVEWGYGRWLDTDGSKKDETRVFCVRFGDGGL